MNETLLAAIFALLAAILTQIILRADANRRELRDRFYAAISQEQMVSERMAYKARELIYSGVLLNEDVATITAVKANIHSQLFSSVFESSQLTTVSAEMTSFGISTQCYVRESHQLRKFVFEICIEHSNGKIEMDKAVDDVICRVKGHAKTATLLIDRIKRRFTILGCLSNLHSGNKLK